MSWLRDFGEHPAAARPLVCFPHGGASATVYREWAQDLPDFHVYGVQYPGRGDRFNEPLVEDVRTAARQVAAAVVPLSSRPVALFGHSLGAYMAYETALLMEAAGRAADVLFVSGARAPHDPARREERCAGLEDDAFLKAVGKLGGTDVELLTDHDLREVLLPILRGDYQAAENYRARCAAPLSCPLVCAVGDRDPLTDPRDASLWGELTRGGFASHLFPGGHFFLAEGRTDVVRMVLSHLTDRKAEHDH